MNPEQPARFTTQQRSRIDRITAAALELSVSERDAFVARECADDEAVLAEILALLDQVQRTDAEAFLAMPATLPQWETKAGEEPNQLPAELIPPPEATQIGPYRILSKIGEGGFGVVYMAEQERPLRRRVALKIIKLGMDTRLVIARFEQERQALAMMDHPNIARVLDAGATDTGRPYFVMDLVKGEPIVDYCDRNSLSIDARLDLFAQICTAVQHAHTKGIIHRDIKSSNVLVSSVDGQPSVKVIDFGIAKATQARLVEQTMFTDLGQLIGTPEYMSPEQAEGSIDIDTRTDVYSLGVLLYELLTGSTPFSSKELRSAAYAEIQRIIREVEPPAPSTRISQNSDTIASVAAKRHTEPKKLGTLVRGELDWIVMKALEKDRSRRYETAIGLGMDVRRYLSGEAVVAAPPSAAYRFKKFIRRNRGIVVSGSAVAAALWIGLIAFAWQAKVARNQRDRAISAESETKKRAEELKLVSDFQADMLAQVDPTEAGKMLSKNVIEKFAAATAKLSVPDDQRASQNAQFENFWQRVNATDTARDLIDQTILKPAISDIDDKFGSQPLVAARLRQVLADRYQGLGLFEAAMSLQSSALATRKRLLGENHVDTVNSLSGMGGLLLTQDKFAEAEPYLREALDKRRRVLGPDHTDTLTSVDLVGVLLQSQGKFAEAEPYYREGLERRRRLLGEENRETLESILGMGILLHREGKLAEAEPYYREALPKYRRLLGEENKKTLNAINNFGALLQAQGRLTEAEPLFLEALEKRRRILGEAHPHTLYSISNMGVLLRDQGRIAESIPYFRDALEKERRLLGPRHSLTLTTTLNLGAVLLAQHKLDEAETYLLEASRGLREVFGEDDANTLISEIYLGTLRVGKGNYAETAASLASIEPKVRKAFTGPSSVRVASLLASLGKARAGLGDFATAEGNLLEARTIALNTRGEAHADTARFTQALVEFYTARDIAEPKKGYGTQADAWKAKLEHIQPSTKP